jgi:hypothetical protein
LKQEINLFFNVLNVYPKKFQRNLEVSTEICPPQLNKYDSFEYPSGLNYLSPTYRITNTNHPRFTKAEKEDNSRSFIYHDSFYFPNPEDSLLFFNFSRYNDIITMAYKNTFFNDGKKLMEINTFNKLEAFDHNTSNFPYIEVNHTKEKNPWMAKDVLKGDSLILHNRNPTYNGDTIVLDYREKSKFIFVRSHFRELDRGEKDTIKLDVNTNLPFNYLKVTNTYQFNNGRIELNFDSSHVSPYPYYIVVRAENTTPHIPFGVTLDSSDFVTWAYIPVYITDTTRSDLQRPKPVEIKEYDAFEMFPNPAKQSCYFNYGLKIASVAIYSSTGGLINNIYINDKYYRLSTELLPDGIYFLHFTDELGSQWIRKLVVQK